MEFISKKRNLIKISIILFVFIAFGIIMMACPKEGISYDYQEENDVQILSYKNNSNLLESANSISPIYLSDLNPISKNVGWGSLLNDKDSSGNKITLKIENNWFSFDKGVWAHAKSTLVYDLSQYTEEYKYFDAFIGINKTSSKGNGVIYNFYLSDDNKTWKEAKTGIIKKPSENATHVEIPLNGAKYLKIYINDNGNNGNDHSVLGDARLIKDNKNSFAIESVDLITEQIKNDYPSQTEINQNLEYLLLKKELVKRIGHYTLNSFYNTSEENKATIDWLLNNHKVLKYYILGGTPNGGSYYNSLTELTRLYRNYKEDFNKTEVTKYGTVLGDLYLRMAISLSLTHAYRVGLWINNASNDYNQSDSVRRYAIYRYMHKNELLKGVNGADIGEWFEDYTIEEMRYVMASSIDDESILWLNAYTQELIDKYGSRYLTPHPYIAYVNPNDNNPVFYAEENREYFNNLFSVPDPNNEGERIGMWDLEYKVPGGVDTPEYSLKIQNGYRIYKPWIAFRNKFGTGVVCGGISKSGTIIKGVHGIPAAVVGQPGHAAYILYSRNSNGEGYWSIDNDVSGWAYSGAGGAGGAIFNVGRPLLGWGSAPYAKGSTGSYIPLAQEVINHNDTYEQSELLIYLADIYNGDIAKKEEIYRKALEIQPLNLDAWYGLILAYNSSNDKTQSQYYDLVEEIANTLKYYPLPMYNMINLIKPKLTSAEYSYLYALLETRTLKEGSSIANNSTAVLQPSITRIIANYLLGQINNDIASFSFNGPDAGKIILSDRFNGNGVRFDYSLDGKKTWTEVAFTADEPHKLQLSQTEINSITDENDIYVHIVGVGYEEENLFKINITKGVISNNLFGNDLENRVIGVNTTYEWRNSENDKWTSYATASPDNSGDKTLEVRVGAVGTTLPSESRKFTFTADNQPDTRRYIPIAHLTVDSYSSQSKDGKRPFYAPNAIDGNGNTLWHTDFSKNVLNESVKPFMIIKLDKPRYISALEFQQLQYKVGDPCLIKNARIYVSEDKENWIEAGKVENLPANTDLKIINFEESVLGSYVKIEMDTYNMFAALSLVNIFQDLSKNPRPTAGIAYSTVNPTNGEVIARLVNPSTQITITNNNGSDTYVFKENGEFTFNFKDIDGNEGTAVAKVDWIDKDIPSADVDYELDKNKKVVISLDNISEDVYLLDKNNDKINFIEVKDGKANKINYLDKNNEIVKVVDIDENGSINKITYKNTSSNVPRVESFTTILTNGIITSEDYYDEDGNLIDDLSAAEKDALKVQNVAISNPLEYTLESSGDYEFKLLDLADNVTVKSVKVDYTNNIILASDISYNITKLTNNDVVAQINAYVIDENGQKENAVLLDSETKYTFSNNGEFTFNYKNKQDITNYNVENHTAKVTWIDKVAPTAKVNYTTLDNGQVKATLVDESETIKIVNREYIFKENGTYTFEFEDMAGNKGYAEAVVDSIKNQEVKPDPIPDNKPDDTPVIDNNQNNKPNSNNSSNISNNNKDTGNNNSNINNDSTDIPSDEDDSKTPVDDDKTDKPNDKNQNNNKVNQDNNRLEEVEEKKPSKGIYLILGAIIVILGVIITGIIMSRNED